MKKCVFIFLVLIAILCIGCTAERLFNAEVLDDFVDSLESDYEFLYNSKIRQSQGQITIKLYFNSESSIEFDESIYTMISEFFLDEEVQEKIITAYDSDKLIGDEYPKIIVRFIDKSDLKTHYIASPVKTINYGDSNVTENRYGEWSNPFYYKSND